MAARHIIIPLLSAVLVTGTAPGDSLPCPEPESLDSDSPVIAPATERLAELFPCFDHTAELPEPFRHLTVHDSAGTLLGFQLESEVAGTTQNGFIGPVPVRVFADTSGSLLGIDLLDNCETPGYWRLVESSDLVQRLLAYRAGTRTDIDAVTLATFTSVGVIQSVIATVDAFFGPPEEPGK